MSELSGRVVVRILGAVLLACLVVGVVVYGWQRRQIKAVASDYEGQIRDLEYRLSLVPTTTPAVRLPAVVYSRGGLLEATGAGRVEKLVLEQKLIRPYIDYHNEDAVRVIALHIIVPTAVGEPYQVVGIFSDGEQGINEFLFGRREEAYDYWEPICMGPCIFSEQFAEKYPEIADQN